MDREIPGKDLHLILDNYGTHKKDEVKKWLNRHKRFHLHFTPTGASWMNMVETWFGILTNQAIRRGSFDSVANLIGAIKAFLSPGTKDDVEEIHESLWSWGEFREGLRLLVSAVRRRLRRGRMKLVRVGAVRRSSGDDLGRLLGVMWHAGGTRRLMNMPGDWGKSSPMGVIR